VGDHARGKLDAEHARIDGQRDPEHAAPRLILVRRRRLGASAASTGHIVTSI